MKTSPLPKLTLPTYNITLPASGKKVKYRPFIVREQKILLMSIESEDYSNVLEALKTIISECTFGKIKVEDLSIPDLSFLFINIRAKSVGEIVNPLLTCKKCKESNEVEIDLTKIKMKTNKKHKKKIILEGDKGLIMKCPTIGMPNLTAKTTDTFSMISDCIEMIFDGDNVYKSEEYKKEELVKFVEELSTKQFEEVLDFFYTLPELTHEVLFECSKCKTKNKIKLEGLHDFFL
jgi:hypothetical protein